MTKPTFKNFIKKIIEAKNQQEAWDNVFYGTIRDEEGKIVEYGIDIAYQHEKITWNEYEMLCDLIGKMAK